MPRFPTARILSILVLLAFLPAAAATAPSPARKPAAKPKPRRPPLDLVWHVETLDGVVLDSKAADSPINPASVVKVATSMWALERLGPDHRFETRVLTRGDALVFEGDGDPDFQYENAFLVAAALNDMGILRVSGPLVVGSKFWMGWEGGSAGTKSDAQTRGMLMATRLRKGLDPSRWDRGTWATWRAFAARRSLDAAHPPKVVILGGLKVETAPGGGDLVLVHRSNSLESTLRRFNCFSNNDIERVGSALGTAGELAINLAARWGSEDGEVQLATTSGLGENRLTPRLVVRLLRDFRNTAEARGKRIEDLLPVAGCDPGTVASFFPRLTSDPNATSLVGKTGTLTTTDGGIAVLAGFVNTSQGEVLFCVAAPKAIGRLRTARRAEETWVLDLLAKQGGPRPRFCAPPLADSDTGAMVLTALPAEPTR